MTGLASFFISTPAILLLWISFSSRRPYGWRGGKDDRQEKQLESGQGRQAGETVGEWDKKDGREKQ